MSWETQSWAARQRPGSSSAKLVLLGLASCADANHCAFPSVDWLCAFGDLNRKTVIAAIQRLEEAELIEDTGERRGRTGQVKVYRLNAGEQANSSALGSDPETAHKPARNGADEKVPKAEPYRKRNSSESTVKQSQKRDTEPFREPLPPCSPDGEQTPTGVAATVANGDSGEAQTRRPKRQPAGSRLPEDWTPPAIADLSPIVRRDVGQWPAGAYEAKCEAFRLHFLAQTGPRAFKRDWLAALAEWLLGDHAKVLREAKAGVIFAHHVPVADSVTAERTKRSRAVEPVSERSFESFREEAIRNAIVNDYGGQEPRWLASAAIACAKIDEAGDVVGVKLIVPVGHVDGVEGHAGRVKAIANRDTSLTIEWVNVEPTKGKRGA